MSVYFIQVEGTDEVKIGEGNVAERLATFQTAHGKKLKIIRTAEGGRSVERWLHRFYEREKIRGECYHFREDMMTLDIPTPEELGGHPARRSKAIDLSAGLSQIKPGESILIVGQVRLAVREFRRRDSRERRQYVGCSAYLQFKIAFDPEGIRVWRLEDL